ncbi:hypothetical protein [Thermoactinospora rubra]|uniref:hypothetical protein n=1 Tax=Thermoactinospora rubra TaxID=1088767 RepID=UPI000A10B3C6|nr:hypothetical protein [Thermoactinospora rubra]
MLKKLAFSGAVIAAFAGAALATPAQADTWPNALEKNVSEASGNIAVCGNRSIGDIIIVLVPVSPVTVADKEPVDCSVKVVQD